MSDDDRTRREGQPRRETEDHTRLEGEATAGAASYLARGTLLGRYVVLDVVGEGGMGVVYRAFDPELDRKVAIKLLQTREGGSSSTNDHKTWLVREAQALARLAHPNVVAVHDVGTLVGPAGGEIVFLAMELVEGTTLRHWLRGVPKGRPWRAVLPVMVAAGTGLAAAHRAELVHRDFKPDNILVSDDGRVRVMDFGLARLDVEDAKRTSDLSIETRSPLTEQLTQAGEVMGTPAYMAPEIYRGKPADARSDQFAFGVALFESLYRARPYKKRDLVSGTERAPRMPEKANELGIPARVQRVVMRAIAFDPDQRYPSMDALLAELGREPDAHRRTIKMVVGLGVVAATAIAAVILLHGTARRELCTGSEQRLVGVWDPSIAKQVAGAFTATKQPFSAPAFVGIERGLDSYAHAWASAVTESCAATRVRGEQTEDVLSLREACLDRHLDELHAVTHLLVEADAAMVERGDAIVSGLDPLAACANVEMLRAPGLPPPAIRPQIAELAKQLAAARADSVTGHYVGALSKAAGVLDRAKALDFAPTIAEARMIHGAALLTVGNFTEASDDFRDAVYQAIRGKRDDIAAAGGLSMALVTSNAGGKPSEAAIWLGHAKALGSRHPDRTFDLKVLQVEGVIAAESGDSAAAIAADEKALLVAEEIYGKDNPALLTNLVVLADAYSHAGAYRKAAPSYERAKQFRIASVGPEHPDIALLESDLGACYNHLGERDKARAAFEHSLAIREQAYGKTSPLLVATLDNFGELLRKQGDLTTALAYQERAIALCKIVPGVAHPMFHQLGTDYADTLIAAKKFVQARSELEQLFALEQANKSPTLPASQTTRAELALAENATPDAEHYAELAIAGYEAAGGVTNAALWRPLTALARAKLAIGKHGEAKALVDRALAIAAQAQISDEDLAPTKQLLAELVTTSFP